VDWLTVEGRLAVNTVLRLESLQTDFAKLRLVLNLPPRDLPCRNWNFHWHYSAYYDEASRKLVGDYYAKDVQAFGYEFESKKNCLRWLLVERLSIRLRSAVKMLFPMG
jgi:hypothetical protein